MPRAAFGAECIFKCSVADEEALDWLEKIILCERLVCILALNISSIYLKAARAAPCGIQFQVQA